MIDKLSLAILYLLSFGVAGYALVAYSVLPLGALVAPDMQATFQAHAFGIYTHIYGSALALLLGPFQFSSSLRQRRPKLHRWIGRAYLSIGVLIGGLAGLYMAFHAFGGMVAKLGFGCLALAWLYTGTKAYLAIRHREIASHRRWMIRNFALTLAAVTLRLYLPLGFVAGIAFEISYPIIAWACWLPNLLLAEWFFNRKPRAGVLHQEKTLNPDP